MGARWAWALVAAVAAGAVAVTVMAVVDDGPQPAGAQATTTTTTAPGSEGGGAATNAPLRTVTVTAEGTASGTPDTAVVQLGVQTQATSAKGALDQANQKAAQLLDALKFGGVKPEDITTTNVFVYPQYGPNDQKITGYQAGNSVSATIRDVTKAGAIIDAAAGVVGDQITLQGVSFNIDDTGRLRQAARDDAVAHAKSQADQLAAATGLTVGKVVSIVEGSVPDIPLVYAAAAPATTVADSAAVPLQPGQQELNLSVTVVYELTS
jgi:uncharacterized protein YggE